MADEASALPPSHDSRSGSSTLASQESSIRRSDNSTDEIMEQSQPSNYNSIDQEMTIPSVSVTTNIESEDGEFSQITCGQRSQNPEESPINLYHETTSTTSQVIETIPQSSPEIDFSLNNEHRQSLPSQPFSPDNASRNKYAPPTKVHKYHNLDLNEIEMPSQLPSTNDLCYIENQTSDTALSGNAKVYHRSKQVLPPMNPTLESMGKNNVLLIRLQTENSKEILTNPILIHKLIYQSDFKKLRIKDIRINKKKDIIAIENSEALQDREIDILTKIEKLGKFPVKCYIPNMEKYTYGVISPISLDIDLEELRQQLMNENDLNVIRIDRLKRRDRNTNMWTDSQSLKLVYNSPSIATEVFIYKMKFNVRPYLPDPMQCYRCQRLGHTSKSCTARIQRCMLCGGTHSKDDCNTSIRFCVNCKEEGHSSNSRQCPSLATAREIDKVMAEQKIDYSTARHNVTSALKLKQNENYTLNSREFPTMDNPNEDNYPNTRTSILHHSSKSTGTRQVASTYAEKAATQKTFYRSDYLNVTNLPKKNYRSISTQTDKDSNTETASRNQLDDDFFIKLRNLILDILTLNTSTEKYNKQTFTNIADDALRQNFGVDVSTSNEKTNPDENNNLKQKKRRKKVSPCGIQYIEKTSTEEDDVLSNNETHESDSEGNEIWETVEKTVRKKDDRNPVPQTRRSKRKKKNSKSSKH